MKIKTFESADKPIYEVGEDGIKDVKGWKSGMLVIEEEVNAFLSDLNPKAVKDIKYQMTWMWLGNHEDSGMIYTAMVMYE